VDATPQSPDPAEPAPAATAGPALAGTVEPDAAATGPVLQPALRLWVSAVALLPQLVIALAARPPSDPAGARSLLALGWALVATAWPGQLALVGGASAMAASPSQLRALGAGLAQLIRAAVPCLIAGLAIAIGCLALVIPGLILLVLLALTAASRERGLPAPLLDSIAAVRPQLAAVALTVAAMFAIDGAIGAIALRALLGALPAKPVPAQLTGVRELVRATAAALVVLSPLPACALAQLRARARG
jgi:hypothetical protein